MTRLSEAPSGFLVMVSSLHPQRSFLRCATGQLSKDTWHHMFPCAVMTAPSTAFMAASLWRLSDHRHVQPSIRAAGRSLVFVYRQLLLHDRHLRGAVCIYFVLHYKEKCMQAAVWNLQPNPWGGEEEGWDEWAGGGDERWSKDSERKLKEAEWERQRWRQREERETKGVWSSRSLCLAAQWLKRRVPGERGGSRPAQSVLSLPWSPACRPQKHTAKPSGRASFIAPGPPTAPKNLQSKHRLSWHRLLFNLEEGGLPRMSCCLDPEEVAFFFFFLMF